MNSLATVNNQAESIGRAIDRHTDQLSSDVTGFIIALDLTEDDMQRLNELADKSQQRSLSAPEEQELEEYRRYGRLMEMTKLKAGMVRNRWKATSLQIEHDTE